MNALKNTPPAVNAWDAGYVESMYEQWRDDPESVGEDWRQFFRGFDLGLRGAPAATAAPATSGDGAAGRETNGAAAPAPAPSHAPSGAILPAVAAAPVSQRRGWAGAESSQVAKQAGVYSLIVNYRMLGHFVATLDVLGNNPPTHPLLELAQFGLSDDDLDTFFDASTLFPPRAAMLRDILGDLRDTYAGTIGVEHLHIQNTPERRWLQEKLEPIRSQPTYSAERHRQMLMKVRMAEGFEKYLHTKYVGQKRFSLEGGESAIVALDALVRRAADTYGMSDVILGMAHRGRLNVLANVMDKSYELLFSEFEDNFLPDSSQGDGDVKYHKGFTSDYTTEQGNQIHLTLTANPSHLEAVDPVVCGRARAKQALWSRRKGLVAQQHGLIRTDARESCASHGATLREPAYPHASRRKAVLPVLIHGDAAFIGQGIVWETLNLSQLEGYTTGGTIHVIINNQIGFTTSPDDARSTHYCTDIAKGIQAPILHVNGDDVPAVAFCMELALDYRQKFGKDVVVDIFGFRRWGHNESDEPAFTQPLLYDRIRAHRGVAAIYTDALIEMGVLSRDDLALLDLEIEETLKKAQQGAKAATRTAIWRMIEGQAFKGEWADLKTPFTHDPVDTGVPYETLRSLGERLAAVPADFEPHAKLRKLLAARLKAVTERGAIDWATGEQLAFATLLAEGSPVRLTGQDCRRGTFSHRHAVLTDGRTGNEYTPLGNLAPDQAPFEVYDSPLSEAAVLGFEYGVSLADPQSLVLWEAQFGDFTNSAQVIVDQFLSCAESKWRRSSGLVLLLPHGYEGQGPEHSSARLERFLQLCGEDNMYVCNLTSPAQYFHVLRRQMKRGFRKPLVIMTPKSLLRHPRAVSEVGELSDGRFREIIDDAAIDAKAAATVQRIVFCTGKVYYELTEARGAAPEDQAARVAIVRVEQIHPLHEALVKEIAERYKNASEFVWTQEEPENMGAWTFIRPLLRETLGQRIRFVGRGPAASPATGSLRQHQHEQEALVAASVGAAPLTADVRV